jgi:hypothetical protein
MVIVYRSPIARLVAWLRGRDEIELPTITLGELLVVKLHTRPMLAAWARARAARPTNVRPR